MRAPRAGGGGCVALVASACLLTSSALLTAPAPSPPPVTCPGNKTHSSYKCPPKKICCKLGCCDPLPELTVEAAVTVALLVALLVAGALLVWWLQWRPRRPPGDRRQQLIPEPGAEEEREGDAEDEWEGRRASVTGPTSSSVLQ
ncbi:Protein of unknown function [Gryllus bimaculatus]|nr:Protein of unknown function [Gryllus bimaculatus]